MDRVFQPIWQPQFAQGLQPFQVGQHMLGLGCPRRLTQPDQSAALGALTNRQQCVERSTVVIGQGCCQRLIDLSRATRQRFAAYPVDHVERRQDDALLPQQIDQRFGEHDAPVGLLGQFGELLHEVPVISGREWCKVQPCLQFQQVLAPSLRALRVLRPDVRLNVQLAADDIQKGCGRFRFTGQSKARIAQVAQLHCEAETVVIAAPLTYHRQVCLG